MDDKRLFELATEYERLKSEMKKVKTEMNQVLENLGVDTYHQDPVTGLVYKVIIPDGTFVSFDKIGYKRTAKEGEKGGTVLSKSEAESQGFVVFK